MIVAVAGLLTAPALAQGFDCREATTSAEHLICGNEDLGMKDRAINDFSIADMPRAVALELFPGRLMDWTMVEAGAEGR